MCIRGNALNPEFLNMIPWKLWMELGVSKTNLSLDLLKLIKSISKFDAKSVKE